MFNQNVLVLHPRIAAYLWAWWLVMLDEYLFEQCRLSMSLTPEEIAVSRWIQNGWHLYDWMEENADQDHVSLEKLDFTKMPDEEAAVFLPREFQYVCLEQSESYCDFSKDFTLTYG